METSQQKKESIEFMKAINNIMEIVDEISETIPEGKYLSLSNNLKKLYDYKEALKQTIVYVNAERRTRTSRVAAPKLTREEKLKDPSYIICKWCDDVLKKKSVYKHLLTESCGKVFLSKEQTNAQGKILLNTAALLEADSKDIKVLKQKVEEREMVE